MAETVDICKIAYSSELDHLILFSEFPVLLENLEFAEQVLKPEDIKEGTRTAINWILFNKTVHDNFLHCQVSFQIPI